MEEFLKTPQVISDAAKFENHCYLVIGFFLLKL